MGLPNPARNLARAGLGRIWEKWPDLGFAGARTRCNPKNVPPQQFPIKFTFGAWPNPEVTGGGGAVKQKASVCSVVEFQAHTIHDRQTNRRTDRRNALGPSVGRPEMLSSVYGAINNSHDFLTRYYHRLNGSSSPVLTATCLSYGSLCDFLGFFPQPTWRSHPSTDFDANGSNDVDLRTHVPFGVKIESF